jgi:hypothetical protein
MRIQGEIYRRLHNWAYYIRYIDASEPGYIRQDILRSPYVPISDEIYRCLHNIVYEPKHIDASITAYTRRDK